MATKILFSEQQRFKQWWLWAIFLVISVVPLYLLFRELLAPEPFSNPENNTGILISLLIILPVSVLFMVMRLKTKITESGIAVQFFPLHLKYHHFSWEEMQEVYVHEYSPIFDFGGWGLRYSLSGAGKAYNVSGNQGIQIVFKNGKKLLIGTQKPAEAAEALRQAQPVQV